MDYNAPDFVAQLILIFVTCTYVLLRSKNQYFDHSTELMPKFMM